MPEETIEEILDDSVDAEDSQTSIPVDIDSSYIEEFDNCDLFD